MRVLRTLLKEVENLDDPDCQFLDILDLRRVTSAI